MMAENIAISTINWQSKQPNSWGSNHIINDKNQQW